MKTEKSIMKKVKAVAVPVAGLVVPAGITILSAGLTKKYAPEQSSKYKAVLQSVAISAITAYVSSKVTEHSVTEVATQCDQVDEVVETFKEIRGAMYGQN